MQLGEITKTQVPLQTTENLSEANKLNNNGCKIQMQ